MHISLFGRGPEAARGRLAIAEAIIMKWVLGVLAVMGYACALGCARREISSEGKLVRVADCRPSTDPPQAIEMVEAAIRAIPSKAPFMERFEWGRAESGDPAISHVLLVTFKDLQTAFDPAYYKAIRGLEGHGNPDAVHVRAGLGPPYLFHDATPHVRTAIRGRLRRVVLVEFKPNTPREEMRKFEDAIAALPKEIPAIERLEWGAQINCDRGYPKPIDPAYRNGEYCLLFTFKSSRERDACLSHPAYKEFQTMLEHYVGKQNPANERGYAGHVEYVARPD
jgi:hypothetical protein